ncbi:AsmA-like C-terminal domain-containing protein [Thermodesulfobacteriota bacterium]
MNRKKKIAIWMAGALTLLLILLVALLPLANKYINRTAVLGKIQTMISREIEGEVEFQQIDLSFFFLPHITVHGIKLSIPGKATGNLKYLKIHPEILPLLKGELGISSVTLGNPAIEIRIAPPLENTSESTSQVTIEEKAAGAIGTIQSEFPNLDVRIKNGRIDIVEENKSLFRFQNLDAHLEIDTLEIDFSCNSNLWDKISVTGSITPDTLQGKGNIELTRFRPDVLSEYLYPGASFGIAESQVNLTLRFETDRLNLTRARVQGDIPVLNLFRESNQIPVKCKNIKGTFLKGENETTVVLDQLELDYPKLGISGEFIVAHSSKEISQAVRLEIIGKNIDVDSARESALAFGNQIGIIPEIFNIVKGGQVPAITFSAEGKSLSDLGKLENIAIKGSISDGKIMVPVGRLNLEGVKGDVLISKGVLEGENLDARLGNTLVNKGSLRLGLAGDDLFFHLDVNLNADLSELPPVLKRFLEDERFTKEINQISELEGTAHGKLVLGENLDDINVKVDVSDFHLSAKHELLPYRLEIDKGQFRFADTQIELKESIGKMGGSYFSKLSMNLDWRGTPQIEVSAAEMKIGLAEIHSWISTDAGLSQKIKDIKDLKGTLALNNFSLKGPLSEPQKWQFHTDGKTEKLAMNTAFLPGTLTSDIARFTATENEILIKEARVKILEGSLSGSCVIKGYLEGIQAIDLSLQGESGPRLNTWLGDVIKLPPALLMNPRVISKSSVIWEASGKTIVGADVEMFNGTRVSGDSLFSADEINVKKLSIQDNASRALITFGYKDDIISSSFEGNLTKSTLENLYSDNQILDGWLKGNFQANIPLNKPLTSEFHGRLMGKDIIFRERIKLPFRINDMSVALQKNKVVVETADLTWENSNIRVEGNVDFSPEKIGVDGALAADELDLGDILKKLKQEGAAKSDESSQAWKLPPAHGTLSLKTDRFKYGDFILKPLQAEVRFHEKDVNITVKEANSCGIAFPGTIQISPEQIQLDFTTHAENQDLTSTLKCLLKKDYHVQGNYNFKGEISGQGSTAELPDALLGNFHFKTENGKIYKFDVISKIFSILNVTEVFSGKIPDLTAQGFSYNYLQSNSTLKDHQLVFNDIVLDADTMKITSEGHIDLRNKNLDFTVLVAPLKTVDRVVNKIPVFREILGGTLIAIPIQVRGDLDDPVVVPLGPGAVGSRLLDIMKRTVEMPMRLIEPAQPSKSQP